jgi:hypothetical protein
VFHDRSKHIDIWHHHIKVCMQQNIMLLQYIPTEYQDAYILTKALTRSKFEYHRDRIGVKDIPFLLRGSVEIQQEDPSENYAPTLGWSLRLFLGGRLFLDDEQILFIDVCQLLLSLNNSWTININLFSMSTWK